MTLSQPSNGGGELQPIPMINGLDCPSCGHPTLILANGGYVTCSLEDCSNPDYAAALLAREKRLVREAERRSNKSLLSDAKYIEQADKKIAVMEADIAYAIGRCQGLGYPDKYLERRYPELVFEKKTNGDMRPE